jgi:hypothetical protein
MGPGRHETWQDTEIGYALWWLTHPERGASDPASVVDRILARGHAQTRAEARAIVRQAQADITATERAQRGTAVQSLRAACNYECDPATPIGVRIRLDVVDARGNLVESRSIVIQATAGENLGDVLARARNTFNRRYRRGTSHRSGQLRIDRDVTPEDIDQILLGYTQGTR